MRPLPCLRRHRRGRRRRARLRGLTRPRALLPCRLSQWTRPTSDDGEPRCVALSLFWSLWAQSASTTDSRSARRRRRLRRLGRAARCVGLPLACTLSHLTSTDSTSPHSPSAAFTCTDRGRRARAAEVRPPSSPSLSVSRRGPSLTVSPLPPLLPRAQQNRRRGARSARRGPERERERAPSRRSVNAGPAEGTRLRELVGGSMDTFSLYCAQRRGEESASEPGKRDPRQSPGAAWLRAASSDRAWRASASLTGKADAEQAKRARPSVTRQSSPGQAEPRWPGEGDRPCPGRARLSWPAKLVPGFAWLALAVEPWTAGQGQARQCRPASFAPSSHFSLSLNGLPLALTAGQAPRVGSLSTSHDCLLRCLTARPPFAQPRARPAPLALDPRPPTQARSGRSG